MVATKRISIPFPFGGYVSNTAYARQNPKPAGATTAYARNVRGFDPRSDRLRGGSRWGHSKALASQINGSDPLQALMQVVISASLSGTSVRNTYNMAVAGGVVKKWVAGGSATAASGTGSLTTTPYLGAAQLFGVVYFADGTNWTKWDAATNTLSAWTASAGSLPVSGSDTPRLIERFRGRIVLSGLKGDGHNYFMTAVGDATDLDYGPEDLTETMAVAGNNSETGELQDVVTALIPFSDETMLFGGDSSLWVLDSDPAAGGRFYNVSHSIGVAFGRAWCRSPLGQVFFFGSQGGLYALAPSNDLQVRRLSTPIERDLRQVDLSKTSVRLSWIDQAKGVMVYLTPTDGSTATHYFYDAENDAWWPDTFATAAHQPRCVMTSDGDLEGDRFTVLGCGDGYLRKIDFAAKSDDGVAIASDVRLGPVMSKGGEPLQLMGHRLQLASTPTASNPVRATVLDGWSAEDAFADTGRFYTDWTTSRRDFSRQRATGSALFFKLTQNTLDHAWAMEDLTAEVTARNTRIL